MAPKKPASKSKVQQRPASPAASSAPLGGAVLVAAITAALQLALSHGHLAALGPNSARKPHGDFNVR